MNTFNDLRIGVRLGIGFALMIATILGVAIYARVALHGVNAELHLLTDDRMVKVGQLVEIKDNVRTIASSIRTMALTSDASLREAEVKSIQESRAQNGKFVSQLEDTIKAEKGVALLKASADKRAAYNEGVGKVIALIAANKTEEATTALLGEMRPAQLAYLKTLDELTDFQRELMKSSSEGVDASVTGAATMMIALASVVGLLGALLAWLITRSITTPLRQAVDLAETVARGDLRSRIEVSSKDETGQLLSALKRMNEALINTVSTVRGNAESVATASSQIAQGNLDLSQRTEEQASNLQQTAASMEQLTATVKQNADTARQAAQLASGASGVASQGGNVVSRVVSTMEDISASSRKISDIIGTIDGIAFQTNILALNAAVEAARASEQGRGFAVVASEVRNLAQRSAQAAKEIKGLIGASVEKVQAGTALVGDAGRTMDEIVTQVKRVSDLLSEISAAGVEQTQGIAQISDAVMQLDQVTQQNAALVEESAAAAESLSVQAGQLSQAVSFFTTADSGHVAKGPQGGLMAPRPAAAQHRSAPAARPAAVKPRASAARASTEPPATAGASDEWTSF